jgi:uncharacterized protein (DUF488 family)
MKLLATIGYEGAELADFIATLHTVGITRLVDVRECPMSRKKGFSKRALDEALTSAGIAYEHVQALGAPRTIRDKLRANGDWVGYFRDFESYLSSQLPLLGELANRIQEGAVLMCYERDPNFCHRKSVSRELGRIAGLEVRHLGVKPGAARTSPRLHTGQGLPATQPAL